MNNKNIFINETDSQIHTRREFIIKTAKLGGLVVLTNLGIESMSSYFLGMNMANATEDKHSNMKKNIPRHKSSFSGLFYPADAAQCEQELKKYTAFDTSKVVFLGKPLGGIVPHAGWAFSGHTTGKVFSFLKQRGNPKIFFVLGGFHRAYGDKPAIIAEGEWDTPLGGVRIAENVAKKLIAKCQFPMLTDARYHDGEHSIEVQIPFIKYLFPNASIVPILVPPNKNAISLGKSIGEILSSKPAGETVVVGSTDLTHYGEAYGFAPKGKGKEALKWVKEVNDKQFIDNVLKFNVDRIIPDAIEKRNACSPGPVAAAVAAARKGGATKGVLLEYTTSYDIMPDGEPSMWCGYAGIIF